MKNNKIGIIGCGNMGATLLKGLLAGKFASKQIVIADKDKKRRDYMRRQYKVSVVGNIDLVSLSSVIILAVKPQDMDKLLTQIRCSLKGNITDKLFVSIAAGLSTRHIESLLKDVSVLRVMPNAPALIGCGISVISLGKYAKNKDYRKAEKIFKLVGEVIQVKESLINKVTAISGSGPAYFFLFIKYLTEAAVKLGLDKKTAKQLVNYTALGSVKMLINTKEEVDKLINNVASRGGTTEAALRIFKNKKLENTINLAVKAAVKRAEELNKRRK